MWRTVVHVCRPPRGMSMWYCNTCRREVYTGQEPEHQGHDVEYRPYVVSPGDDRLR